MLVAWKAAPTDKNSVVEKAYSMVALSDVLWVGLKDASMVVHLVDCSVEVKADLLVASMDKHWVAEMVLMTDTTWAVCSVDMMGVLLAVAMDALSAVHWVE